MRRRRAARWLLVSIAVVLGLLPSPGGNRPAGGAARSGGPALALRAELAAGELRVLRDGATSEIFPLASPPGHLPPRGEFEVRRVVWQPRWSPLEASRARGPRTRAHPGLPSGRVRIALGETGYVIHADTDPGSFRDAFTHRCLVLGEADLVELARLLVREGSAGRPPTLLRRVLAGATGTTLVRLDAPVEITIR